MHTVDLLEESLILAERFGFSVRKRWLADGQGGACRIGQQRVLFVNLAASAEEQLQQVLEGLRAAEIDLDDAEVSDSLKRLLS